MSRQLSGILAGAFLLAPGLLIPSTMLIEIMHGPAGGLQQQLLLGALLFRTVLVVSGLYMILLGFLPFDKVAVKSDEATGRGDGSNLLILSMLVVSAFIVRLYKLDQGIWLDEILAYINYMPMSAGGIFTTFDDPNNHLLYTLMANLSFDVFGESTRSLRLPAVLFGVASIPALYYFARQVSSARESLFSAALLAFSYHHIWFSQNARGYTALLFFTLLSSGFLLRAMRINSMGCWFLYAFAASLGVLTHLTMGFVIVAQFLVYLAPIVTSRAPQGLERWTGLLAGFMVVGLLSCLSYAFVLPQMLSGGMASGAQGTVAEWTNPVWMALEIVRGMQVGFTGGLVAFLAFLVFGIGLADFVRRQPVLPALLLIPSLLGFLIMISINYTLFPRFFFFEMGFAVIVVIRGAMLAGAGLGRLLRLPGAASGWPGAVLCSGLVAVAVLSIPFAFGPKQDYEGALVLIEQQKLAGDAVVTVGIADIPYSRFYMTDWVKVETRQALDRIRAENRRTWVVYTMPLHTEAAYPEIFADINKDFVEIKRFHGTLNGGEVVVSRAGS